VADASEPDGGRCFVLLTATGAAASVRLSGTSGRSRTVSIAAGHSADVDVTGLVGSGTPHPLALVKVSGGPVYATRVLSFHGAHGPLVTAEPIASLPRPVAQARLREDPRLLQR
jgi:hypothetical protein